MAEASKPAARQQRVSLISAALLPVLLPASLDQTIVSRDRGRYQGSSLSAAVPGPSR